MENSWEVESWYDDSVKKGRWEFSRIYWPSDRYRTATYIVKLGVKKYTIRFFDPIGIENDVDGPYPQGTPKVRGNFRTLKAAKIAYLMCIKNENHR